MLLLSGHQTSPLSSRHASGEEKKKEERTTRILATPSFFYSSFMSVGEGGGRSSAWGVAAPFLRTRLRTEHRWPPSLSSSRACVGQEEWRRNSTGVSFTASVSLIKHL